MPTKAPLSLSTLFAGYNNPVVLALGLTQTIGYGTLYYFYGVLAPTIANEFGIGIDWFFAAFTIGLVLGGKVAPFVGKQLDKHGARPVMAFGSLFAALALVLCSLAQNEWTFAFAVIIMEMAACFVLYEAAFAGLTQIYRHEARQSITLITLIAGFASTIFWPLTQFILQDYGWRLTFVIFALGHLFVCLPLHWLFLKKAVPTKKVEESPDQKTTTVVLQGLQRQHALLYYTIAIVVSGIVYSAFPVHMLRIIENEGFTAQTAALIAMFMGPAQVIARLIEVLARHKFDPLVTGKAALGALTISIVLLLALPSSAPTAILFAMFYGTAQGLITIARGTIPLFLFGADGYATLVGRITGLRFFANAFSPFLFALAMTHLNIDAALVVCALASLISLALFFQLKEPTKS